MLLTILNYLGLNSVMDDSSEPIVKIGFSILLITIISLLCIINVMLYFVALQVLNNERILNKISKYVYLIKFLNLVKKTSVLGIVLEVIVILYCQFWIINICLIIVRG